MGKYNGKAGTLTYDRGNADLSFMQQDDLFTYGEPEAMATGLVGVCAPVEGLEYLAELFRGDADAVVFYLYPDAFGREVYCYGNGIVRGVFQGIIQQVKEKYLEQAVVALADQFCILFGDFQEAEVYPGRFVGFSPAYSGGMFQFNKVAHFQ